jgi:hypothetical protein
VCMYFRYESHFESQFNMMNPWIPIHCDESLFNLMNHYS